MPESLFNELFANMDGGIRTEDQEKATALLGVVTKSTASLGDVVKLADALGLTLHFVAKSKPIPEPEAPKDPTQTKDAR